MTKTCIICGLAAGSGEHIFPASLGGRRTNRGIYCSKHDNGFSPLASVIAEQLSVINALLSVRNDHTGEAKSVIVTDEDGQDYRLCGNSLTLVTAPQPPPAGDGQPQSLVFATRQEAEAWIAEQRKAGYTIESVSMEAQSRLPPAGIRPRMSIGGTEGLRAVGYIALTFFANYFPALARQSEADAFKAFVCGTSATQRVWWECSNPPPGLPKQPFPFGHTLAIVVDAEAAHAHVYTAFFGALCFTADLGPVKANTTETVVTFIDPLAPHPPDDIKVIRDAQVLFPIHRPDGLTDNLAELIESGNGQRALQRLMRDIWRHNTDCDMQELADELKTARTLPEPEQRQQIRAIVDRQRPRLLRHMQYVVANFPAEGGLVSFAPVLQQMIRRDASAASGLAPSCEAVLQVIVTSFSDALMQLMQHETISTADLILMFTEGPGAAAVCNIMFHLAMRDVWPA